MLYYTLFTLNQISSDIIVIGNISKIPTQESTWPSSRALANPKLRLWSSSSDLYGKLEGELVILLFGAEILRIQEKYKYYKNTKITTRHSVKKPQKILDDFLCLKRIFSLASFWYTVKRLGGVFLLITQINYNAIPMAKILPWISPIAGLLIIQYLHHRQASMFQWTLKRLKR